MSQYWDEQDSDVESPSLDGHDNDKGDKNAKPGRKKNPKYVPTTYSGIPLT